MSLREEILQELEEWDCYCRKCGGSAATEDCIKNHRGSVVVFLTDVDVVLARVENQDCYCEKLRIVQESRNKHLEAAMIAEDKHIKELSGLREQIKQELMGV